MCLPPDLFGYFGDNHALVSYNPCDDNASSDNRKQSLPHLNLKQNLLLFFQDNYTWYCFVNDLI